MNKVLLSNNIKSKNGVKIKITSIFNTSFEIIWSKIINIDTLIYICKPMVRFTLLSKDKPKIWETNKEYIFKLFIYGVIPLGKHRITLKNIDKNNGIIISNENNNIVKIWNHKIEMNIIEEKITTYTDEVDIYAGIFTIIVALFGLIFYKHRQKKWKKLINEF